MEPKGFFSKHSTVAQKQYEALRMFFVENKSAKEVAQTFGYTYRGSVPQLLWASNPPIAPLKTEIAKYTFINCIKDKYISKIFYRQPKSNIVCQYNSFIINQN